MHSELDRQAGIQYSLKTQNGKFARWELTLKIRRTKAWPTHVAEARAIQESLHGKIIARDRFGKIRTVAGIDVGFEKQGTVTRAAVVVLGFPSLVPVEQAVARQPTRFPYVPGYLSFREAPAVLAAMKKLRRRPDLLLCDGQGLAHPRRFGLACHLGLLLDIPSIGVAKSRLIGTHDEVPAHKGGWTPLLDHPSSSSPSLLPHGEKGASRGALRAHPEIIGVALRTRTGVKPVYVSVGHRISLATAIRYVLRCTTRYRLPETTRSAHRLASTNL
jgi:deoxyribonuclease V